MRNLWTKMVDLLADNAHETEDSIDLLDELKKLDPVFLGLDNAMKAYRVDLAELIEKNSCDVKDIASKKEHIVELTAAAQQALSTEQRALALQRANEIQQLLTFVQEDNYAVSHRSQRITNFHLELISAEVMVDGYKQLVAMIRASDGEGEDMQDAISFKALNYILESLYLSNAAVYNGANPEGDVNDIRIDERLFTDVQNILDMTRTQIILDRIVKAMPSRSMP